MQWWCPPSSMGVRHGLCKGGTRARYRHVREMMFLKERKVWLDRMKNGDMRRSLGQETVMDIVKKKQRRWKVRMEEKNDD